MAQEALGKPFETARNLTEAEREYVHFTLVNFKDEEHIGKLVNMNLSDEFNLDKLLLYKEYYKM